MGKTFWGRISPPPGSEKPEKGPVLIRLKMRDTYKDGDPLRSLEEKQIIVKKGKNNLESSQCPVLSLPRLLL